MKLQCFRNYFVTALSVLLSACLLPRLEAQTGQPALGATGAAPGGQHVELEVTAEGATLEFDCASGTITQPLQVDAQGNFQDYGDVSGGSARARSCATARRLRRQPIQGRFRTAR